MDPNSEIHEISSDEDGTWDEGSDDNLDWISELLDPDGGETEDSDDVVFMGEIQISKPTDRVKPVSGDVFDDDCTILETDPDNPVAVENDSADGSDELLIVGEKGQLACRDFPHPRHLCAKFPFSSTPHDKYCDLCHCYVCDSHAPCSDWGTGVCTTDHCHSNDKEEEWKLQRKFFKQGKLPSTPGQKLPNNTLPMMPALPNQTPAFNLLQLPNSGSVTHSVYSPSLSACSLTTSFGVPSIIGHRSNQCPGLTLNRNRCPQNLSRSSLMPGTHNLIRRERNEIVGALGPQFTTQRFKRVGSVPTVFPMDQHGYGSSNSRNSYKSHPLKNQHPLVLLNHDINVSWQDILAGSDPNFGSCESNSQPNTGSNFTEFQLYTTAQTHVYGQHIPQSVGDQNLDQHENPAPVAVNPSVLDFNSVWMDGSTQGAKHSTSEASQIQGVQPISDLLNDQSFYQNESLPVSASNPHYTGIPNPGSSDLENWRSSLDYDESDSGIAKDSMPCELDFVPLPPSPVEPAMLYYDMESSWNLAHV
ncbi:uncharacterized protein LOC122070296 [Macadamia integrifolia]|uniref:uncharacterized protein LOC122070296 n=1 Tax=Macadamia integrifolia TaxID=60698 RepID=UPI001C4E3D23|nr:uncharacterized protein LOC122070296 [Macadamia integrifolia]